MRLSIGRATLIGLFMVGNVTAQVVSPGMDSCKDSGGVMVTVTDSSGAVVPNAFVPFRADRRGTAISKEFLLELRTDSTGKRAASLPCGYIDFFVAADGFTPHTEKILIEGQNTLLSVKLKMHPITEY